MMKYITFLRGINVGGHKVIKMDDLKEMFVAMKFNNVHTYIQSGNVIFESSGTEVNSLGKKIQSRLLKAFGYSVEIFLRTMQEIEELIINNPFKDRELNNNIKLYVTFLSGEPGENQKQLIKDIDSISEMFEFGNKEIYCLRNKVLEADKPFLSTNYIERKIGLLATTRDWNTIKKVVEL